MQVNKQLIAIIILASLLFSAIGAALFYYKKNIQTQKKKSELVTIYIAKEDIPRDTLLTIEHLAQTKIAREFILNTPLLKDEIIGKYTNEKIYKHEVFLKQKLDTQVEVEEKILLDFEKSAYNMKFELFKNPNYSIKQGEYINIISVFPEGKSDNKGRFSDFDVQYVASNIKVLGFIRDGRQESQTITKHMIDKIENKKPVKKLIEIKADELIVDIDLEILLKLIENYNRGTQLWMVKTKIPEQNIELTNTETKEEKQKTTEEPIEKTVEIKKFVPIKYKYRMFESKKTVMTKSAVIDYSSDKEKEKSITRNVDIIIDSNKICSQINDKFILGISNSFYIRSSASKNSQRKEVLNKNIIIPFIEKQGDWYKTCDQRFIHESVVKEVDKNFIQNKLGKYE
uniref:hypothetical protein n=1 Tax=Aliarcobacter sp. TaxID=2321116 RepID=UPI0040487AAF